MAKLPAQGEVCKVHLTDPVVMKAIIKDAKKLEGGLTDANLLAAAQKAQVSAQEEREAITAKLQEVAAAVGDKRRKAKAALKNVQQLMGGAAQIELTGVDGASKLRQLDIAKAVYRKLFAKDMPEEEVQRFNTFVLRTPLTESELIKQEAEKAQSEEEKENGIISSIDANELKIRGDLRRSFIMKLAEFFKPTRDSLPQFGTTHSGPALIARAMRAHQKEFFQKLLEDDAAAQLQEGETLDEHSARIASRIMELEAKGARGSLNPTVYDEAAYQDWLNGQGVFAALPKGAENEEVFLRTIAGNMSHDEYISTFRKMRSMVTYVPMGLVVQKDGYSLVPAAEVRKDMMEKYKVAIGTSRAQYTASSPAEAGQNFARMQKIWIDALKTNPTALALAKGANSDGFGYHDVTPEEKERFNKLVYNDPKLRDAVSTALATLSGIDKSMWETAIAHGKGSNKSVTSVTMAMWNLSYRLNVQHGNAASLIRDTGIRLPGGVYAKLSTLIGDDKAVQIHLEGKKKAKPDEGALAERAYNAITDAWNKQTLPNIFDFSFGDRLTKDAPEWVLSPLEQLIKSVSIRDVYEDQYPRMINSPSGNSITNARYHGPQTISVAMSNDDLIRQSVPVKFIGATNMESNESVDAQDMTDPQTKFEDAMYESDPDMMYTSYWNGDRASEDGLWHPKPSRMKKYADQFKALHARLPRETTPEERKRRVKELDQELARYVIDMVTLGGLRSWKDAKDMQKRSATFSSQGELPLQMKGGLPRFIKGQIFKDGTPAHSDGAVYFWGALEKELAISSGSLSPSLIALEETFDALEPDDQAEFRKAMEARYGIKPKEGVNPVTALLEKMYEANRSYKYLASRVGQDQVPLLVKGNWYKGDEAYMKMLTPESPIYQAIERMNAYNDMRGTTPLETVTLAISSETVKSKMQKKLALDVDKQGNIAEGSTFWMPTYSTLFKQASLSNDSHTGISNLPFQSISDMQATLDEADVLNRILERAVAANIDEINKSTDEEITAEVISKSEDLLVKELYEKGLGRFSPAMVERLDQSLESYMRKQGRLSLQGMQMVAMPAMGSPLVEDTVDNANGDRIWGIGIAHINGSNHEYGQRFPSLEDAKNYLIKRIRNGHRMDMVDLSKTKYGSEESAINAWRAMRREDANAEIAKALRQYEIRLKYYGNVNLPVFVPGTFVFVNRTPGTSISSHILVRLGDDPGASFGNHIMLHQSLVARAGADFDGDTWGVFLQSKSVDKDGKRRIIYDASQVADGDDKAASVTATNAYISGIQKMYSRLPLEVLRTMTSGDVLIAKPSEDNPQGGPLYDMAAAIAKEITANAMKNDEKLRTDAPQYLQGLARDGKNALGATVNTGGLLKIMLEGETGVTLFSLGTVKLPATSAKDPGGVTEAATTIDLSGGNLNVAKASPAEKIIKIQMARQIQRLTNNMVNQIVDDTKHLNAAMFGFARVSGGLADLLIYHMGPSELIQEGVPNDEMANRAYRKVVRWLRTPAVQRLVEISKEWNQVMQQDKTGKLGFLGAEVVEELLTKRPRTGINRKGDVFELPLKEGTEAYKRLFPKSYEESKAMPSADVDLIVQLMRESFDLRKAANIAKAGYAKSGGYFTSAAQPLAEILAEKEKFNVGLPMDFADRPLVKAGNSTLKLIRDRVFTPEVHPYDQAKVNVMLGEPRSFLASMAGLKSLRGLSEENKIEILKLETERVARLIAEAEAKGKTAYINGNPANGSLSLQDKKYQTARYMAALVLNHLEMESTAKDEVLTTDPADLANMIAKAMEDNPEAFGVLADNLRINVSNKPETKMTVDEALAKLGYKLTREAYAKKLTETQMLHAESEEGEDYAEEEDIDWDSMHSDIDEAADTSREAKPRTRSESGRSIRPGPKNYRVRLLGISSASLTPMESSKLRAMFESIPETIVFKDDAGNPHTWTKNDMITALGRLAIMKYGVTLGSLGKGNYLPFLPIDFLKGLQLAMREHPGALAPETRAYVLGLTDTYKSPAGVARALPQEDMAQVAVAAKKEALPEGAKAEETARVQLPPTGPYTPKDQKKSDMATKFIGRGSEASSTAKYAKAWGERANGGSYTASDRVFISAEGSRAGRLEPDYNEIQRALNAGATIITDDRANRERPYNSGERAIAEYLTKNGYSEDGNTGIWKPAAKQEAAAPAAAVEAEPNAPVTEATIKGTLSNLDRLESMGNDLWGSEGAWEDMDWDGNQKLDMEVPVIGNVLYEELSPEGVKGLRQFLTELTPTLSLLDRSPKINVEELGRDLNNILDEGGPEAGGKAVARVRDAVKQLYSGYFAAEALRNQGQKEFYDILQTARQVVEERPAVEREENKVAAKTAHVNTEVVEPFREPKALKLKFNALGSLEEAADNGEYVYEGGSMGAAQVELATENEKMNPLVKSLETVMSKYGFTLKELPTGALYDMLATASKELTKPNGKNDEQFITQSAQALSYMLYPLMFERDQLRESRAELAKVLEHSLFTKYQEAGGTVSQSVYDRVWKAVQNLVKAFREWFMINRDKVDQTLNALLAGENVFLNEGDAAPTRPGMERVNLQQQFDREPRAKEIMTAIMDTGWKYALSGSVAYAPQMSVYRKAGGTAHDLDVIVAPGDMKRWKRELKAKFAGTTDLYQFGLTQDSLVSGVVVPPVGYTVSEASSKNFPKTDDPASVKTDRKFKLLDSEGKEAGSYHLVSRYNGETTEDIKGVKAVIVDLITDTRLKDKKSIVQTPFTDSKNNQRQLDISHYKYGMEAKLDYLRSKDMRDYRWLAPLAEESREPVDNVGATQIELTGDIALKYNPTTVQSRALYAEFRKQFSLMEALQTKHNKIYEYTRRLLGTGTVDYLEPMKRVPGVTDNKPVFDADRKSRIAWDEKDRQIMGYYEALATLIAEDPVIGEALRPLIIRKEYGKLHNLIMKRFEKMPVALGLYLKKEIDPVTGQEKEIPEKDLSGNLISNNMTAAQFWKIIQDSAAKTKMEQAGRRAQLTIEGLADMAKGFADLRAEIYNHFSQYIGHLDNYVPRYYGYGWDGSTLVREARDRVNRALSRVMKPVKATDTLLTAAEYIQPAEGSDFPPATDLQKDLIRKYDLTYKRVMASKSYTDAQYFSKMNMAEANGIIVRSLRMDQYHESQDKGKTFIPDAKKIKTIAKLEAVAANYGKKAWSSRAQSRVLKAGTYAEAYEKYGMRPDTLSVLDLHKRYVRDTMTSLTNRAIMEKLATHTDYTGKPAVVLVPVEKPSGKSAISAQALLDHAILVAGYLGKPTHELSLKNAGQKLRDMATGSTQFAQYEKIPSTFDGIAEIRALPGDAAAIAKHISLEPVKWIFGDVDYAAQLTRVAQWSKMMSVGMSVFFPISLLESVAAGTGLKDNILWSKKESVFRDFNGLRKALKDVYYGKQDPRSRWSVYLQELTEYGGQFGESQVTDEAKGQVDKDIANMVEWVRLNEGEKAAKIAEKIFHYGTGRAASNVFFNDWFPVVKLWAAHRLSHSIAAELGLDFDGNLLDRKLVMRITAPIINDAYGGQFWKRYLWANPRNMQFLNWTMFAPNWTISNANLGGLGLLTGSTLGNTLSNEGANFAFFKNWPAMIVLVMMAAPMALQAAINAAGKAMGNGDGDDDSWLMLNNEEGRQSYIDITPVLRHMPMYDGDPTGKRRVYMRFGKQGYEVVDGWLSEPINQFMRKLSQPARLVWEEVTGRSPGSDWNLEFQGQGMAGWLRTEKEGADAFLTSRLGYAAQKFLPMSVIQILKDPSTGILPAIAPLSKGKSMGMATKDFTELMQVYADDEAYNALLQSPVANERLKALAPGLLDAAAKNGYNVDKIVNTAKGTILGKIYKHMWDAANNGDMEAMDRYAKQALRVGGSIQGAQRSMKNQVKNFNREYTPEMQAAIDEAFKGTSGEKK